MKTERRFFKELRFRQLRALVELSRRKTFSAVASVLGLSVPSAWRQVRALEEQFGVQLVVAEGQQVSLTEDGRLLMELAEPLVESFNSLRALFDDRLERKQRKLTVVAPSGVLSNELPKPLKHYRRLFPKVSRTLIDRPSRPAREMLEAGKADIAIVGLPAGDELPSSLTMRPLTRYPFMLICPEDHALAVAKKLTLRQIVQHPLVLASEESGSRIQLERVFLKAGLHDRMNVTMTASTLPLIMSYVGMNFGVSLITAASTFKLPASRQGQPRLILRNIQDLFGHEQVVLLQRKGRYELPHVKAFRELVEENFLTQVGSR
jgi:DNA-binding transcriptional LysR family regulator